MVVVNISRGNLKEMRRRQEPSEGGKLAYNRVPCAIVKLLWINGRFLADGVPLKTIVTVKDAILIAAAPGVVGQIARNQISGRHSESHCHFNGISPCGQE